jgi:large subunit ribosomal protein L31
MVLVATSKGRKPMGLGLLSQGLLVRCATLIFQTVEAHAIKAETYPEYHAIEAECSCGTEIQIGSTLAEDIRLDVCSNCHPFYTGKQKTIDAVGRVQRYRKRFGNRNSAGS